MKKSPVFLLYAIVCIIAFGLSACAKKKKPTEPPTGPPVSILFFSDPPGATVYFDRDSIGVTQEGIAVRLDSVVWGEYTYRLALKGYKTYVRNLNITSASTKRVEVELLLLLGIEVITDPPGATIYVNGDPQQDVTPALIEDLPEGKYTISVQKTGYFSQEGEVSISKETGGESFYVQLAEVPAIKDFYFAIIDRNKPLDEGGILDDTPPFSQSLVKPSMANLNRYGYVEVRFEQPTKVGFNLKFEVAWIPHESTRESVIKKDYITVAEGDQVASLDFRNLDGDARTATTLLQKGTYIIRLYNGREVMGEGQFLMR